MALAVVWPQPVCGRQPEIVGAATGLTSEGEQGFPETWFTVKLQTPLSFFLKSWWRTRAVNVGELLETTPVSRPGIFTDSLRTLGTQGRKPWCYTPELLNAEHEQARLHHGRRV